ncbi:MAG: tetratricopeptide repeat protein [Pyrinomonadaceae bacterium]|nr:tetratricopeptide repeat protein [Pyrinomonadaceae bacterium]
MRIKILIVAAVFLFAADVTASECATNAKVVKPKLDIKTRATFLAKKAAAESRFRFNPENAEAMIWVGRRTAYLGEYKKAIEIYTNGIRKHPEDARFYRHRGHRYISIRCFDDAIKDFEKAAELFKGKPDQVEPDGLPNALNIPTSTLQSNTWYHLGLAHYLKGDFEKALTAYRSCLYVSKNPDMFVATANWLYVTLRRLGKEEAASEMLDLIEDDLDIIENDSYFDLLKLYKGDKTTAELAGAKGDALSNASVTYGLGNWALINGNKKEAKVFFERVLSGTQWSSFGYIASEAEMARLKTED